MDLRSSQVWRASIKLNGMSHFPKLLSSQVAFDMAQSLLAGFQRHYSIFREAGTAAKTCFEAQDWFGVSQLQRNRIDYYDQRVQETVEVLEILS
jgi:isocitrate dehydrogenase kinase/phosphatase